ncbi:MAG: hypothetical protein MK135_07540 [Polyangiaceae bacterium]|nr:hypothetical protein [Polyangiaceae bacterium]
MERRSGFRARTDFSVQAMNGYWASQARAIEVSCTGIVLDRGRELSERDMPFLIDLELRLPERNRPIRVKARPVRREGSHQVLRFIDISAVDRLNLAEHLDVLMARGVQLH